MKDKMIRPTLFGIYSILCAVFFISAGFSVGSLLILAAGLILLPSRFNLGLWNDRGGRFVAFLAALSLVLLVLGLILLPKGTFASLFGGETETKQETLCENGFDYEKIPVFSGKPYVELNGGRPYFTSEELAFSEPFERYSELDGYDRCGPAFAAVCPEIMPENERESVTSVTPSGWVQAKYDHIDQNNLYNRCHLIGFQLSGENANPRNIVTGTRFLNVNGMLPFENSVAEYVHNTGGTVLYRVTPVFKGDELVCRGVVIEAFSVGDGGKGICFNVFCYNAQPGVTIDYATGNSRLSG